MCNNVSNKQKINNCWNLKNKKSCIIKIYSRLIQKNKNYLNMINDSKTIILFDLISHLISTKFVRTIELHDGYIMSLHYYW